MITQDWILILFCSATAVLTFFLVSKLKFGVTRASSLVGLMLVLLSYIINDNMDETIVSQFLMAGFGATFVGMTSPSIERKYIVIALGGLFYGFLIKIGSTIDVFKGFGGLLGTMACSGLLVSLSITRILGRNKNSVLS